MAIMTGFATLRERLLNEIRRRIHNGEGTERGLARAVGISQPHMHNLLKGIRGLNADTSDLLLMRLGINMTDLLRADELRRALYVRVLEDETAVEIPVAKTRLGPGLPWTGEPSDFERVRVPLSYVAVAGNPLVARLGDDPSMAPVLAAGDLVLLDSSEGRLALTDPEALFAVEREKSLVIRWVRRGRARCYIAAAEDRDEPHRWETVTRPPQTFLRARAIPLRWMHRQEVLYDPLLPPRDTPRELVPRSSSN